MVGAWDVPSIHIRATKAGPRNPEPEGQEQASRVGKRKANR